MKNPIKIIRDFFKPRDLAGRATDILRQRGFREVVALGGQNSDWNTSALSMDSSVWQNIFMLRQRARDLADTNPYWSKLRELYWANVFGENGIMLRMDVKETEDRVVNSPDEKSYIRSWEKRRNDLFGYYAKKENRTHEPTIHLREFGENGSRKANVQIGDLDLYAIKVIEDGWKEWQRAEYCDARGRRSYQVLQQLRLWSAARDGDHFIYMVKSPGVNKFGFTLRLVNAEWCDYFYNDNLSNGNVVRMGIEYQQFTWGLGKPVAFYFIRRQPNDWQFSIPGAFGFAQGGMHDRIPAEDIVHYARYTDADSTRPAPWGANTIPKSRQLDQFELAEVIAARAAACKTGWLESTVIPEGGYAGDPPNPALINTNSMTIEAGGLYGLPWGVTLKESDPKHPTQNFEEFRKGMLRSWCAGMPAADYNTIANDLEGINFSAGRLGRLDTNEMSMLLQRFDIDTAERPIFENWLRMSLICGALPLGSYSESKFRKFNKAEFSGRRWQQVDEIKAVNSAALRVANGFSCDQYECDAFGTDFEDVCFKQAEANKLKEQLGLTTIKTVESPPNDAPAEDTEGGNESDTAAATGGTKKPAAKKPKSKRLTLAEE